jgi:hypothetical protein
MESGAAPSEAILTTPDSASSTDEPAAKSIESEAHRFNRMVMRKLQRAIDADPEIDLASKLPRNYSSRLADRKTEGSQTRLSIWPELAD